jgi:hypothetical protein
MTNRNLLSIARAVVPAPLRRLIRTARRTWHEGVLRRQTPEQVFTEIYSSNAWGGARGEFSSGSGTRDDAVVAPYVAAIERLADELGFRGTAFVDLGCGDFRVGKRLLPLCGSYTGVDVVRGLVAHNNSVHGGDTTRFVALDLTRDELPPGDVCFVRQVLQHLSNAEIARILPKLSGYRWVFITEHHPTPGPHVVPNLDKVHGANVRAAFHSGVYLDQPPFSLPAHSLEHVVDAPGAGLGSGVDQGVIRTFLYRPPR